MTKIRVINNASVVLKNLTLKSFPLRSTPLMKGRTPVAAISDSLMSTAQTSTILGREGETVDLLPPPSGPRGNAFCLFGELPFPRCRYKVTLDCSHKVVRRKITAIENKS